MPFRVILTPEAQDHLQQLEIYIAEASYPQTAANYIERLTDALDTLASAPFQGTRREDLGVGLRTTGFERRITILFAVTGSEVIVVGIFYAGRQLKPAK